MADLASPLLGALSGGALRLVPEVLGFFDRKARRKHELDLGNQQLELMKAQAATRLEEAQVNADQAQTVAAINAMAENIKAQAQPTGIKFVDALSSLVRPTWTYMLLLNWASIKYIGIAVALNQGADWQTIGPMAWTVDDTTMISTILTFWFTDRTLMRSAQRGK